MNSVSVNRTLRRMAPEMLVPVQEPQEVSYGLAVDIWALGITGARN
jgi:hypothetical protein